MVLKFDIQVLGCKVNQYDGASLGCALERMGLKRADRKEAPDLVIVQTCSVTQAAERQGRQLLRRMRESYPGAYIVATGCQAEVHGDELKGLRGINLVWGNRNRAGLLEKIASDLGLSKAALGSCDLQWGEGLLGLPGRTRAYVKVQDGCDAQCTYCIVPKARGPSRSRPAESIIKAVRLLEEAGVKEVVLTGVHLGLYGADLRPRISLEELLGLLLERCHMRRIRLSSIEPNELSGELIELISKNQRICPHLHVPIQSGSREILRLMNRPYCPEECRDKLFEAHRKIPDLVIGADIIVGFPGETEKHFQETWMFLEEIPWTYLHVFPFSPRPGTKAWEMPRIKPIEIVKERARLLREFSSERKQQVAGLYKGRVVEVLVERPWRSRQGWWEGHTRNYLLCRFPAGGEVVGECVEVLAEAAEQGAILARLLANGRTLGLTGSLG